MGNSESEIPPGTLEMLVLKTLKRFGPMHEGRKQLDAEISNTGACPRQSSG
jgi:hypothetical protein